MQVDMPFSTDKAEVVCVSGEPSAGEVGEILLEK